MTELEKTTVNTKNGKLKGLFRDGLYLFRGVRYAAPPVGENRWLPPGPVEPWQGVRPARIFGPTAPQGASTISMFRQPADEEPQDEDCLFLNIWTPGLDNARRPVMVWIHGGAFARGSGSSARHSGDLLAKRGDTVIVGVNYRLGPFGFLRLKEATGGAIPATGNEGLLDQIAALRWVKDNIASFGGDPGNITVFGESAGAMSIGCLLAMPQANGLFQKAILESGANTVRPLEPAIRIGQKYLANLGLGTDAGALREAPPEALLSVSLTQQDTGRGAAFEPVVDGETLPEIPLDAIKKGSAKEVIVLSGSNLDEARLFGMSSPALKNLDDAGLAARVGRLLPADYAPKIIETYRTLRKKRGLDAAPAQILMAIQTDLQFRIPNVRLAEIQQSLGVKAYSYLFTWESAAPGLGACHALEVGFVFGKTEPGFHGSGPTVSKLCGCIQDAWLAFARSGDPSCASLGPWPVYGRERQTMILGENSHVEPAPYEEERAIWDSVPNELIG